VTLPSGTAALPPTKAHEKRDFPMAPRIRSAVRLALIVLCLAGAWISGELVKQHAGPWPSAARSPGFFGRLCGGDTGNESGCAEVRRSTWSAIDLSVPVLTRALTIRWSRVVVPVAFVGLAYYVFLGSWFAFAGRPRPWGYQWYLVPLLTVTGGAAGSVVLTWVMLFKLGPLCWGCLAAHAINGLLLVGTLCLRPSKAAMAAARSDVRSRDNPVAYAHATLTPGAALKVIGFAALVILGLWVYRGAKLDIRQQVAKLVPYKKLVEEQRSDPAFLLREYYAQPLHAITPRIVNGRGAADNMEPTLVVFGDFQCPYSACFASHWNKRLRPQWHGPLRVSFRHFPLCPDCNGTVIREMHPEACRASYAAEAARLQGGDQAFWRLHDLLFAYGRRLGERSYADLATQIGLDGERLVADMQSDVVRQAVAADILLATELGVSGTPTVFLNGRPVPPFCRGNPLFWDAVSQELSLGTRIAARGGANEAVGEPVGPAPIAAPSRIDP
jgi:hypothetical protein